MDEEEQYRLVKLEKKISQLDLDSITHGLPPPRPMPNSKPLDEMYNAIPIPKENRSRNICTK